MNNLRTTHTYRLYIICAANDSIISHFAENKKIKNKTQSSNLSTKCFSVPKIKMKKKKTKKILENQITEICFQQINQWLSECISAKTFTIYWMKEKYKKLNIWYGCER